ncbi:MAG: DEAD/DEAH box helicase family protein [Rickettsiales bacterium]|nr:DEAD/DEAH box helicase family protein [Rickettsiales bacterium]
MELKDYQIKVLDYLENYLRKLYGQYQDKLDYYEFQKSKGKDANHPETSDYCSETWEEMKASFVVHSPNYTTRRDGLNRNIPNICFKVPTGGGKTLLATCALQRIKQDYFRQNTGFVLWIVPSETIYKQTSKSLRDRQHPYRQMLDRISGGKTIILEKNDKFNKQDVEDNLCVMLLMLQSGNRDNKETLRMFRDSGSFSSFYPEIDDYNANKKLLDLNPDLEVADLVDSGDVISGISIKHSLGNTLKLIRPIVIMDEGHKAASERALNTLNSFNPSFILELSATPKNNSNVLINVRGSELKQEQMIKLPINVFGSEESSWKQTLNHSHKKLQELSKLAEKLQENEGRYIRPIMVIKAEPKKKGNSYDHVEDIKKYLIDNLGVNSEEIRIKLSEKDEIKDEDLLDNLCPVKYIITKDALKEGWDCSFAYILSILSNTKSNVALTQFIGRVLRQPEARATSISELNQCYVYSNSSDVNDTVESIKKGLEQEGMGDLSNDISTSHNQSNLTETVKLKLNDSLLKKDKIFIPKLNVIEGDKIRNFDYYQDILSEIRWDDYSFDNELILKEKDHASYDIFKVDVETNEDKQFELKLGGREVKSEKIEDEIDISLMTSQLMDKVPNPWHATRIINETLKNLKTKFSDIIIAFNSVYIVDEIKKDCFAWVLEKSENIFKNKLESKTIFLKLVCEPFSNLNWEVEDLINVNIQSNESRIELEKNIFQPQYKSLYNNYEYQIASYINKSEAVKWWHRLGVKGTEYYVQGWKRDKIFPDFLIKLQNDDSGTARLQFIETKGDHLKGNLDTEYKKKVFDYLNDLAKKDIEAVGELKLVKDQDELNFQMIFEDEWQTQIRKII